jgi:hypothetical protein
MAISSANFGSRLSTTFANDALMPHPASWKKIAWTILPVATRNDVFFEAYLMYNA